MTVQNQSVRWGPEITPFLVRNLIILTAGLSLISALSEPLLNTLFGLPGLSHLLSLSWQGLHNYYIWQIVSFLFLEDTHGYGLSFVFLIALAFNMYLLWVMGSDLMGRVGEGAFLRFYLLTGVLAGLAALAALHFLGQDRMLSGPGPAILAVLTAWTLFNPEIDLLFFFLFPIKAKWLWVALIGTFLLVSLSHLDWVSLSFYGTAILAGYLYAVMAWDLQGPFTWMHPFDSFFAAVGRMVKKGTRKLLKPSVRKDKIIDFKTGEPLLDDNLFVDAMLEKISRQGEASLSWKERQRLQEISKAKQKNRN